MTQTTDLAIHGAECRTLAERLSEGAIPVTQALRYATLLGESLRKIHDSGKGHGAVSPETILLTAEGLELGPPAESAGPADIQADIFAFGTVLDEMLTSSPGDSPTDAGEHGAGALIAACLARDPAGR